MRKISLLFVALLSFGSVHSQTLIDGIYYDLVPDFDGEGVVAQVVKDPGGAYYIGDLIIPSSVAIEGSTYPVTSIDLSWDVAYPTNLYIPKTIQYIITSKLTPSWSCTHLKSITVSLKDTKIMDKQDGTIHDLNAEFLFDILDDDISLTLLDDTISNLSNILTDKIKVIRFSENLKSINPNVFSSFEPYATSACDTIINNLDSIIVDDNNPYYSSVNGILYDKSGKTLLACPARRKGEVVIPSQTTEIWENAFKNCNKITSVIIPPNVNKIGDNAFYNCDAIENVTIQGTAQIGRDAFLGCPNIANVTLLGTEPGIMELNNQQRSYIVSPNLMKYWNMEKQIYNEELGRMVLHEVWNFDMDLITYIPSGTYTVKAGILPNPTGSVTYLGARITGFSESDQLIYLFEEQIPVPPYHWVAEFESDKDTYDSLVIVERLVIPENIKKLDIYIESKKQSGALFDRVFLEPIQDENTPAQSFAGPFVERVFNRATLHVPASALEAYNESQGWKLFRNITSEPVTEVYDIITSTPQTAPVIYDLYGRKLSEPVRNGFSIINGKKVFMAE